MPRLVTCDEVFEVLTRGPFPTGDPDDGDVELHLGACHECRQLAEALRPAAGLLRESLDEGELPSYRGRVGEAPWTAPAEPPAKPGSSLWLAQVARLAAAALLIAALCAAAGVAGKLRAQSPLTPTALTAHLGASPATRVCFEALQMPAAKAACCTGCHSAHSPPQAVERSREATVQLLAASCRTCHE